MTQSKPVATMLDVIEILNADPRVIAYPQSVVVLQRALAALRANGAPNCEAAKEIRAHLAKRTQSRDLGEAQS